MATPGPNLLNRDRQPELMDQHGLETGPHHEALTGLERINWISASDRIVWGPIRALAEARRRPLRVLDIATGGGDVPIRLHQRARRAGLPITFAGADISPTALDFARARARRQGAEIEFFALDVLRDPMPTDYDVIMSSLFLHHLDTEDAVEFLGRAGRSARSMVLVNDLIRSRLGYLAAWAGTRVLSASRIVHTDGLLSVRAAFTMAEARELAVQAGLAKATLGWRWPWRFLLEWHRPETTS